MPNQPPHPPYSDIYVLPKTKYGIPVTPEMFENNDFAFHGSDPEDRKGHWWIVVWKEQEARRSQVHEKHEKEKEDLSRADRASSGRTMSEEERRPSCTMQRQIPQHKRSRSVIGRIKSVARREDGIREVGDKIGLGEFLDAEEDVLAQVEDEMGFAEFLAAEEGEEEMEMGLGEFLTAEGRAAYSGRDKMGHTVLQVAKVARFAKVGPAARRLSTTMDDAQEEPRLARLNRLLKRLRV